MGKRIKVVGFDPSLSNWGVAQAVLDLETLQIDITSLELAKTTPDKTKQVRRNCDDLDRAQVLHAGMTAGAKGCSIAFVEIPVGSQSARAMASYGVSVGALASCPIPLIPVMPDEVKLAAVGHRLAAKEEMIEWATALYPNAPWITTGKKDTKRYTKANEHLADAVAAIHAGVRTDEFQRLQSVWRSMTFVQ